MALLSAFNPHEFSEYTVRTIATGRESALAEVVRTVRGNIGAASIQHLIVSAPRGYGKSFMMRHVQFELARIARDEQLPLRAVLMPEEMPHVREPESLITELARAIEGGAGGEADLTWHEDEGALWEAATTRLETAMAAAVGPGGLVVALVENFDALIRRAFAKDIQSTRLRELLTRRNSQLMLISASATGAFDRDYDKPLFQAFAEIKLEPWSVDECLIFFARQRMAAGKPPLTPLAEARARAVSEFIGGTPRLATLLADALLDDDVIGAAALLHKLIDELTPYYKERVEALPGRSQKLLDALLRFGEPASQTEIARRVSASGQSAIAGSFRDLIAERIVIGEKAPGSAEMLFRVADRVFAHYFRRRVVQHGHNGCPLEALVDLLAVFFSPEEKRKKVDSFARSGHLAEARVMARLYRADVGAGTGQARRMLFGLREHHLPKRLIPRASPSIADALREVGNALGNGDITVAQQRLDTALTQNIAISDQVILSLCQSRIDHYLGIEAGLSSAQRGRALAEKIDDASLTALALNAEAFSLGQLDRREEAIKTGQSAALLAESAGDAREQAVALGYVAWNLARLGRYEEAIETAQCTALIAERAGDAREQAVALRYAAFSHGQLGSLGEAVETAQRAALLAESAGDVGEQAEALRLSAWSLGQLDQHEEAIETARRSIGLAEVAGDRGLQAVALRYIAWNLGGLGRHEEAIETARSAAVLAQSVGDVGEQAEALRHAAWSLGQLGRHADALLVAVEAVPVIVASGDPVDETLWKDMLRRLGRDAVDGDGDPLSLLSTCQPLMVIVAERFGTSELAQATRREWVNGITDRVIHRLEDPRALHDWASALRLYFGEDGDAIAARLRVAADYHASGRARRSLARVDPDLARTLRVIFPPQ